MKTVALLTVTVLGMALIALLNGCQESSADTAAAQNALRPSKFLTEAVEGRFKGARIDKYAEINAAPGWRTYVAAFTSGGVRRAARVVPGRGIVAWQKAVSASELPALVRDSVRAKAAGAAIRSACELWVRDEKGAEQLAGYRIRYRPRPSSIAEQGWLLQPDGSMMRADPRWVDIDSLIYVDLD
jgi:hypothetical protein